MSVFLQLTTFAQAVPDEPEATPGEIAAGLIVLGVMAGSLGMIIVWWQRWQSGQDLLPTARRKPLRVTLPLMILGIAFSSLLALMTLLATVAPASDGPANEQPAAEQLAEESGSEAGDWAEGDDTAAAEDATDLADVASETDGSQPGEPQTPAVDMAKFRAMLSQTLVMNLAMFMIFGIGVYASQMGAPRRPDAVTGERAEVDADESFPQDADAQIDLLTADEFHNQPTPLNPYASPLLAAPDETTPVGNSQECWQFAREFRFAAETCLVAYLPTAIARIVIVGFLPEAPSHPFLEMLNNGVDWTVMLMIALMAVVVAPLVEELLYRVTILGGIWQQRALPVAWIVSSVLFGFAHGFPDSIALLPLAFLIGYAYIRRRSYRTVVLIHFLFNAFNMVIAGCSML